MAETRLAFEVTFEVDEGLVGTMVIPDQGALRMELLELAIRSGRLHFAIETATGRVFWEGDLKGDSIEGGFRQGGVTGSFRMRRGVEDVAELAEGDREIPYLDEEVSFVSGDITLAGSLIVPSGIGPHPAVVLVSGSGAQDRDANLYGFKVFGKIANHLGRRGIAVLRLDDRGVGGSGGSVLETTLQERAEDVSAALDLLNSRADIDSERIGLVGHSEGGMVAPLAASRRSDVAFLVLLAAPAVSGEVLLTEQVGQVMVAAGESEELIEQAKTQQALVLRAVATDEGWAEVEETIRQAARERIETLPAVWRQAITDIDLYLDDAVRQQIAAVQSPWYRSVVRFDPAPVLGEMTVPALALYGGLDTQVPPNLNVPALTSALAESGSKDYTVTVLERANHLFQEGVSGHPNEYPHLRKEFVPGFLDLIADWILERAGDEDELPADKP